MKVGVHILNSNFESWSFSCNCLVLFIAQVEVGWEKKRREFLDVFCAGGHEHMARAAEPIKLDSANGHKPGYRAHQKKSGVARKKN